MQRSFSLSAVTLLASSLLCGQASAPARLRVAVGEKRVASDNKSREAYNDLAFALCRLARDTGDIADFQKAELAADKSLELSPGNYDARKLLATALIGEHEYERARSLALELNHKVPDDIAGWGLLVDVNIAFGNYTDAERAAQWILDLRRGSTLGFVKAASLRDIFGDPEGAAEFYDEASRRTARSDLDEQSWLLVQEARQVLALGKPERAEDLLKQATSFFPDSQTALTAFAELRNWQGRYVEAAALRERKYQSVSDAGNLYDWAEALDRSGDKQKATTLFQEFEVRAKAAAAKPYNWNLQLIYYYCDRKPDEVAALQLAEREIKARQDWPRLEAYAWSLYRNGRYAEAEKELSKVSSIGVQTPEHLCHASRIAQKTNNLGTVKQNAKKLADAGVRSCPPESVREVALQAGR